MKHLPGELGKSVSFVAFVIALKLVLRVAGKATHRLWDYMFVRWKHIFIAVTFLQLSATYPQFIWKDFTISSTAFYTRINYRDILRLYGDYVLIKHKTDVLRAKYLSIECDRKAEGRIDLRDESIKV